MGGFLGARIIAAACVPFAASAPPPSSSPGCSRRCPRRGRPGRRARARPRTAEAREAFLEKADVVGARQLGKGVTKPVAADPPAGRRRPGRGLPGRRRAQGRSPLPERPHGARLPRLLRLQHRRLPPGPAARLRRPRAGVGRARVEGPARRADLVGRQEVGRGRAGEGGRRAARRAGVGATALPRPRLHRARRRHRSQPRQPAGHRGFPPLAHRLHARLPAYDGAEDAVPAAPHRSALLRSAEGAARRGRRGRAGRRWLDPQARKALLARRDAMVEHFAVLADQRGDKSAVFYESDPMPHRSQEQP